MSTNSTIDLQKPNGNIIPPTDRTELDDLLDEILGDQIFLNSFPSSQQDGNAMQQESETLQQGNGQANNKMACHGNATQANTLTNWESSGRTTNGSGARESIPVENHTTQPAYCSGNHSEVGFAGGWVENGVENQNQMAAGGRSRAPSLPVNYHGADHRRRLQSVPCSDHNGQAYGSQGYYDQPDRFIQRLCSEEPITWLDQQKKKLHTRNENRRWFDQSNQQKQLMEELKMAQMLCARKRSEQAQHDDLAEQRCANSPHVGPGASQTLGHQRYRGAPTEQMNERLRGLNLWQPYDDDFRGNGEMCRTEKNYYVSGIERPPFTTHQTKYVFSVSSPHAANINPIDGSPTVQLNQKVNAKPGPPTPKRVSSRDALRHSVMHDWEPEYWDHESHAFQPTRLDALERMALATADRTDPTGTWNNGDLYHQPTQSSSSAHTDRREIFDVSNAQKAIAHSTNVQTLNFGSLPVTGDGNSIKVGSDSAAANVTCSDPSGNSDSLQNGSSTSGISSLSINSTTQSAFEPPACQCAVYSDARFVNNEWNSPSVASTIPISKPEPDLLPVSASIVVTSHKSAPTSGSSSSSMHQSFSDSALVQSSFSRRSQNLNENALTDPSTDHRVPAIRETCHTCHQSSSSFPSDVPYLPGSTVSSQKPQLLASHASTVVKPPEQPLVVRGREEIQNQAVTRQLAAIAEQSSGPDGSELISLQLIGPGMQTLEPDGDLPAVRPVTPKFPHPGMDANASNSLKKRPDTLDGKRRSTEEKLPPTAAHPKFNSSGQRRATLAVAACGNGAATGDSSGDQSNCNSELRPHSADLLNEDGQTTQRMKHRRHTTVTGQELLRANDADGKRRSSGQNSFSECAPATAYHRTERLLSADFSLPCFNRRGSMSPDEQNRRNSKAFGENEKDGLSCSKTDRLDGMDDVFVTKTGSEATIDKRRRDSKVRKSDQEEFSLAMLDNAVAGLRASAGSPVDEGSSSSNTIVQSPQSGKTTPGFYAGQDTLSPRTSMHHHPLSNETTASLSTNNSTDTSSKTVHAPRFVQDSSKFWHRPRISRDEAISSLKDKPPGTFVIRNSNSFPGAFGLALKVSHLPPNVHSRGGDPKAELVRHFLIEPTSKGVKLKGCSSEPVFGSLAALVYQHSLTPLSLPCKLIIPDQSNLRKSKDGASTSSEVTTTEVLSQGAACNVLYINSVDMESLTGNEAIEKAVAATFSLNPAPLTTVVHFKVLSQGITLTDTNRKLFFRRHYPVDSVTFAGIDPELRSWTWFNEETKSTLKSKIFGFVARQQGSPMDNACHLFAELDNDQPAQAIVEFIMKVMLGRGGRSKKDSIYN